MVIALLLLALATTPVRPTPRLTPGLTRPLLVSTVCTTRWGTDRRKVTVTMRRAVFAAYGIPWANRSAYEVDHLIPRSLGGADHEMNLWPQAWAGIYGARAKDRLEVALGKRVCAGTMTLAFAQDAIRVDWISAYRLYIEGVKGE